MLKKRIFIALCLLLLATSALIYFAIKQARHLHRDPIVLMNKYYQFKNTHPTAAKKALLIILHQDPNNLSALKELAEWSLAQRNPQQAIPWLERLHTLEPNTAIYTFQLAYLYYLSGEWPKAKYLFIQLIAQVTGMLQTQAQQALLAMASYVPSYQYHAIIWTALTQEPRMVEPQHIKENDSHPQATAIYPKIDQTLIHYYTVKRKNTEKAYHVIQTVLQQHPHHLQALQEAGYLAIQEGQPMAAIGYFKQAYALFQDPKIAMQIAYLYDEINDKPNAYRYFQRAATSHQPSLAWSAEKSLTNLSGQQTKALPSPYFSEVFFSPFSQSRFGLTVRPFIFRLGVEQANFFQTKEYLFTRRTDDNRTQNLGEISQIYEDNVQITGVGGQFAPFNTLPLIGFIEAGAAYDLVYRNRDPWRGDLRGGFMYYQEFGAKPSYFDVATFSHNYYSDWYADATYFSRYHNNVIGLIRTHQGIRLLQYRSSMVNLYVTGRVIEDTRRDFFNNIAEIGPGIAIVPSNRFNLQLRFEHINGVYLPAGRLVNPYGKYYTNQLVQLLFYVKL